MSSLGVRRVFDLQVMPWDRSAEDKNIINEGWDPADAHKEWEAHGFNGSFLKELAFQELDQYFRQKTGFKGD